MVGASQIGLTLTKKSQQSHRLMWPCKLPITELAVILQPHDVICIEKQPIDKCVRSSSSSSPHSLLTPLRVDDSLS